MNVVWECENFLFKSPITVVLKIAARTSILIGRNREAFTKKNFI